MVIAVNANAVAKLAVERYIIFPIRIAVPNQIIKPISIAPPIVLFQFIFCFMKVSPFLFRTNLQLQLLLRQKYHMLNLISLVLYLEEL